MSGLFRVNDTLTNKISYYHLMLLMASLPFDKFYSHLILISYGIHTLIHLSKKNIKPVFNLRMLALQSVFIITLLAAIYSTDMKGALDEIGRRAAILVIPILFCLNPFDLKKYRDKLLLFFALICTATLLYLYIDALVTIRHFKLPYAMLFSGYFANHNFSEPIGMHATFFSMQIGLALVFLLWLLLKERAFYKRLLYLTCAIILTCGLVQLSSKSVFVALFLAINIAVPYFLLQGVKRRRYIMIAVSLSVLLVAGILSSAAFRERYVTELATDLSPAKPGESLDSRLARWNVIVKLIEKKPVAGYGTGTELGLLHDNFFTNRLYNSFLHNLNAHNQYLSFLLKSGVIGLLVYLGALAFGFNVSFQQKDLLLFVFMLIITCVSFSENLLDVDKGIFYYAFFYSFFIFSTAGASTAAKPEKTT